MQRALADMIMRLFELCIHSILHVREIYPAILFEKRCAFFGSKSSTFNVWQCRHPEVNIYIQRVLINVRTLVDHGLIERMVFAVRDKNGVDIDHLFIKCTVEDEQRGDNEADICTLEEEFCSILFAISLLDSKKLPVPAKDCSWQVMFVTKETDEGNSSMYQQAQSVIENVVRSGQWLVDNNRVTEQVARARRTAQATTTTSDSNMNMRESSQSTASASFPSSNSAVPVPVPAGPSTLIAIKSFRNDIMNISVNVNVFGR